MTVDIGFKIVEQCIDEGSPDLGEAVIEAVGDSVSESMQPKYEGNRRHRAYTI